MIRSLLLKDSNCNTLECCEETSKFCNLKNNSANINAAAIINLSRHNSSDLNVELRHKYIAHSNSMSIPKDDQTHINQLGGIRYIQNYLKPFLNENNTINNNYNLCGDSSDSNAAAAAATAAAVADNYCTNVLINNEDNDNALLNNIDNNYTAKKGKHGNIGGNNESRFDKDESTTGCSHFVRKHRRNHSYDQIFLPNNKRSDLADNVMNNCGNAPSQHQHIYHYCNYNLPHQHCHHYLPNYGRKKNINLLKNTMSFEQGKAKSFNENSVVTKVSETNSDLNSHSRNNSKDLNIKVSHEMFINLKSVGAGGSAVTDMATTAATASASAIVAANPTIAGLNSENTQSVLRHRRTNSKETNSSSSFQLQAAGNTSTGQLANTGPIPNNALIANSTLCDLSLNSISVALPEDKLIESQINNYEKHLN